MSELLCLQIAMALWLAHVLVQVLVARSEFGDDYLFSSRDEQRQPKGTVCGRASRALENYVQNLVPFVALDLALIAVGNVGGMGATIWIIARILYFPAYLAGVKFLRTGLWLISIIGLIMMFVQLMQAGADAGLAV
ncbi:MAG: hypothetical protein MnENMB40S_01740 [Rhizobiaceae bacterium MnEN-MB40S]|nr:MAG: hypothetical protein MnENMB40S_01740 [Rhizobiaceae bacterium MnEN-MB40S]